MEVKEHHAGEVAAGVHTIRLECVGRGAGSKGARAGLDGVRLRERTGVKRAPLGPK